MLGDRIEAKLDELYKKVRNLLEDNREKVFAIAHALEAYKTVTGEDITAIIEGTPGPLLDGRVYMDSKFIDQLELYHNAVVAAHRDHRQVDAKLPMPPRDLTVVATDAVLLSGDLVLDGAVTMVDTDEL